MGRGKRPDISKNDRQRWLDEFDNGMGITLIANKAGHDIRIVKRHIQIAREERQAALVSHNFLLNKLEKHQKDLLEEVSRIQKLIALYPPISLTPEGPTAKKIFEAFKKHIGHLTLMKTVELWEKLFINYSQFKRDTETEINKKNNFLIAAIQGEIDYYRWTSVIVEILESGFSFRESGRTYNVEKVGDGNYKPSWGDRVLTRSTTTEKQAGLVVEAHKNLVAFAENYLAEFQKYREKFKELSVSLTDELDDIKIKGIVTGRCRYCPA